jgi:DNA-directed RNA polymerase subunit RPC12/RpoP
MSGERYRCGGCGGDLAYQPGQAALACPYCGAQQEIAAPAETVRELDYHAALAKARQEQPTIERREVACAGCGAKVTLRPDVQSDRCPYCATQLTAEPQSASALQPKALLPFAIPRQQAQRTFHGWLTSRWFAPGALKHLVGWEDALQGVYVPYWTYDALTTTAYTGARGEDYWDTESYTAHVNGKPVRRTRSVRKTRWYPAAGVVRNRFDDLLVLATRSLPYERASQLEPWDLKALVPYDAGYVQGFRSESYQIDLDDGFGIAAGRMQPEIAATVRRDIGGDHQRVHSMDVEYHDITFKHILLPVWVSSYRYGKQTYRIMVNAVTGEVQGERPYSVGKILLAVLAGLAAIAGAVLVVSRLAG